MRKEKLERQEEVRARKPTKKEYKNPEEEHYYYENYATESSCEPEELKMEVIARLVHAHSDVIRIIMSLKHQVG